MHEMGVDWFDDKIGQYVMVTSVVISNMEGYTSFAVGEHPYSLSANGEEVINEIFNVLPDYLTFRSNSGTSTIGMTNNGTNASTTKPTIYTSTDKENWSLWDFSAISLDEGDEIYMYGENPQGLNHSTANYSQFTMTGNVSVVGSIMTLIDYSMPNDIPANGCFINLFKNCTAMTEMNGLIMPDGIMKPDTFWYFCYGCTSLTGAPTIPNVKQSASDCFANMFQNCSSLNTLFTYLETPFGNSSWLNGVAATGNFYCPENATFVQGASNGYPAGWTRLDISFS